MAFDESFVDGFTEDIAVLRMRLMARLREIQKELNVMRKSRYPALHYQEYMDLVERMDSARVHLYVAGEYLRGNGEWCLLQDDEEEEMPAYLGMEGA
ncbi:MAG: hypothetical protein LBT16_01290 [Treponema sp.]|jgi:hypothetical protein|nr:hypothetical protein [Treponema sp.]